MTITVPHVMYYAPNVRQAQAGAMPCPRCFPFPFAYEPRAHQATSCSGSENQEFARIVVDKGELVQELCSYRNVLCLSTHQSGQSHSNQHVETSASEGDSGA